MFYLFLVLVAMAFYFKVYAYIKYSLLIFGVMWGVSLMASHFNLMEMLFQYTLKNL